MKLFRKIKIPKLKKISGLTKKEEYKMIKYHIKTMIKRYKQDDIIMLKTLDNTWIPIQDLTDIDFREYLRRVQYVSSKGLKIVIKLEKKKRRIS